MFRFIPPLVAVTALAAAPLRAENIDDFMPSVLAGKTSIPPGGTARFKVVFQPKGKGLRGAGLAVGSNDRTKNPFGIGLTGTGK